MSDGITFNSLQEANKFKKEKSEQGINVLIVKDGNKFKAIFDQTCYRGCVPGQEDASLGKWYSTDEGEADLYRKFKEQKTGKTGQGKVITERIKLDKPFIVTDKENPDSPYDSFLTVSDKIPKLKELVKRDTSLEKEDGEFIVEGEKLITDYAKEHGYDGVIFYGKNVVKF